MQDKEKSPNSAPTLNMFSKLMSFYIFLIILWAFRTTPKKTKKKQKKMKENPTPICLRSKSRFHILSDELLQLRNFSGQTRSFSNNYSVMALRKSKCFSRYTKRKFISDICIRYCSPWCTKLVAGSIRKSTSYKTEHQKQHFN